ncbi:glycerophosphodiester phosphodiesterase [Epibacterium sp. MM17-32]|uniref:glycerophosphodiester phosphodiesterase family protein n=1 Tax=Epibacterium sp. MM17-32 TaxID=2917734 RepID=UPI001EF4BC55|nr:glycerophosphodiester phosphodiesterase family protein [Epibacterium sp. MM17-32]MCG7627153.1 glycerophosphodiester phosphodiesterase [Epibacterium sp. MM17-32]
MSHFPQIDAYRGDAGLIRVIGHRGARGVMPENTLEGFRFTFDIGVDALEFDVVLSSDGVPVITHNHALSPAAVRDAGGAWIAQDDIKVADLPLDELRRLDVGGLDSRSTYGRRFPDQAFLSGVRIPTLADLCALVKEPQYDHVALLLELKTDLSDPDIAAIRVQQVSAVVEVVRAHGLSARTALHSFDWALLDECRRQAPEMPTSYLSEVARAGRDGEPAGLTEASPLPEMVAAAGGQMWCPWFQDITPERMAQARALSLPVTVWTVNETADIEAMIDAGVDGIVTDYPGRVQRLLLERGLRWSDRVPTPAIAT